MSPAGDFKIMLGVSDGDLARRLVAAGGMPLDFLETGGPRAATATALPGVPRVLVHNAVWNWSLAHPRALAVPGVLSTTREVLARTEAPWLSVHLGFASAAVAAERDAMVPRSPVLPRETVRESIVTNARELAAALPVPLLLENLDYWPTGAYEYVSEPAFIADVLEAAPVELLLDLAHAQVAAARLGIPIDDYLALLPLRRVRELHVSGPRLVEGTLCDAHEPLLEEDYRLIALVLREARPQAVTFEYHGDDAAVVAPEISRLRIVLDA